MNRFRSNYIQGLLESEKGELSTLDQEVLDSLKRHETLASNVDDEYEKTFTLGERMADRLADFGGSWNFIVMPRVCFAGMDRRQHAGFGGKAF